MSGIITFGGNHYRFEGWYFELHGYCGPMLLRKNGEPKTSPVPAGFWDAWKRFSALSEEEKQKHLEWQSPGCVHL